MKIIFRVDASSQIGTGHVMRCLTLAKELKKQGGICKFICRDHENNLIKKIRSENFEVIKLNDSINLKSNKISKDEYSNWIGASWKVDANQTIDALNKEIIDLLIIDHYGIDKKWEKKLKPYTKKIMVIDDLANRKHLCDILLDQNLISKFKNRYKNLIPTYCNSFLGPKYALLQNQYKNLHLKANRRTGLTKRIFVYFGGTDHYNLTEIVVLAFLRLLKKDIFLDVVIGTISSQKEKIKKLSQKSKKISIHSNLNSLAPLMLKADLAIGACGVTTWERFCLGLPSIVITTANNQRLITKELHKKKLINYLGNYSDISINKIYQSIKNYINHDLRSWSKSCKLVTDGCGTSRITSILLLNNKSKLKIRRANLEDEELILNWTNDQVVRSNSLNSKIITKKIHKIWFNLKIKNPQVCKIFIFETKAGVPIGQVRFEKKFGKWYISYSLIGLARQKKLSSRILKSAIIEFRKQNKIRLYADVKKNNIASCKAFEKIGFTKRSIYKNDINIFKYQL